MELHFAYGGAIVALVYQLVYGRFRQVKVMLFRQSSTVG